MRTVFTFGLAIFSFSMVLGQELAAEVKYVKILDFSQLKSSMAAEDLWGKKLDDKLEDAGQGQEYLLRINGTVSSYEPIERLLKDPTQQVLSRMQLFYFPGFFYVDIQEGITIHQKDYLGEIYLIKGQISKNWILTKESKTIGKYECFKAELNIGYIDVHGNRRNKKYIAWYTPEIPLQFGPEEFNALPGLILEVQDDKSTLVANEITIYTAGSKTNIDIKKPKKGIEITADELNERAEKFILENMKKKSRF